MVLQSVNDLQENTYCTIERIHFAGPSEPDGTQWRFRWKKLEHIFVFEMQLLSLKEPLMFCCKNGRLEKSTACCARVLLSESMLRSELQITISTLR